jgi:hypothetical protein
MQSQTALPPSKTSFLIFGLAFALMASKSPDSLSNPQFWAEDGTIFFAPQFGSHLPLIGTSYAGYFHVIPRLIAWLATFFGSTKAPLVYNLFGCFLTTWSIYYTVQRLRPYIPLVLSLTIFLFTPTNGEIFGTLTNVQWFTQFALIALCLPVHAPANTLRKEALVAILTGLIALTGPASIFLTTVNIGIMLFAWLLAKARPTRQITLGLNEYVSRLPKVRIAVTGLCALIQIQCVLVHTPLDPHGVTGISQYGIPMLAVIMLGRIIPTHVLGVYFLTPTLWIFIELGILVTLLRSKWLSLEVKVIALQLLAFSLLLVFSAAALKDTEIMLRLMVGDRYFYTFKFVFWWLVYLTVIGHCKTRRKETLALVLCSIVYVGLINSSYLQRQPLQDLSWRTHAQELKTPGPHQIPINPTPWYFQVTTQPTPQINEKQP